MGVAALELRDGRIRPGAGPAGRTDMKRGSSAAGVATGQASRDGDPVVQGILRAISLRRIRPGTKLGEDKLAKAFGTSRMHIRLALAHLSARRIVTHQPNRGAFVWQPSVAEARHIFAARRVLERATVEALVDGLTEEAAEVLRRHVAQEGSHDRSDRWDSLALTAEFHGLIARLAGNSVMLSVVDDLMHRTSLAIASFEPPGSHDCSPDAHPDILALILARDKAGAVAAMDRHLHEIEDRLALDLPRDQPGDLVAIFQDIGVLPASSGP